MANGWTTPPEIHYVRNHGPVPRIDKEQHTLSVGGLVRNPRVFTMDEIRAIESVSYPVLLVCAGNRRREQNMIKQTIGFNWGPSGLSNSVWTGVPLVKLIELCGGLLGDDECKARGDDEPAFIDFEGGDSLPKGIYGTSVNIATALDPLSDILIAYKQNGHELTPDHGYPLRVIVPGFIGGRMVKWLNKISVSSKETSSVYHYMDNRVLPPPAVSAEVAEAEGWWYKPDYIINQLNINSAISSPAHNEVLKLKTFGSTLPKTAYTLKGYAYTGGGRKITRCEISFNRGQTWHHATLQIEDIAEALRIVKVESVSGDSKWRLGCREIALRAWDSGLNTQPPKATWNLMGMMNNPWFKIRTHMQVETAMNDDTVTISFEHPTKSGPEEGGWMKKYDPVAWEIPEGDDPDAKVAQDLSEKKNNTPDPEESNIDPNLQVVDMATVEKHCTEEDCWIVVRKTVYDCTPFLKLHPGGALSIMLVAGTDCTDEFDGIHSEKAKEMLKQYAVARVEGTPKPNETASSETMLPDESSTDAQALKPKQYLAFPLIYREELTSDTRLLRFGLLHKNQISGIQPGQHMMVKLDRPNSSQSKSKVVIRAYTPTSLSHLTKGYFDLVIRVYEHGAASRALDALKVGDKIQVKGPTGHIMYAGGSVFTVPVDPHPSVSRSSSNDALAALDSSRSASNLKNFRTNSGSALASSPRPILPPKVSVSIARSMGFPESPMSPRNNSFARSFSSMKLSYALSSSVNGSSESLGSIVSRATSATSANHSRAIQVDRVNLIAAGTGVTPCWQVIQAIATEWELYDMNASLDSAERQDVSEPPKVWFVYANRSRKDILLANEIHKLASSSLFWLKITYIFSRETGGMKVSDFVTGKDNGTLANEHIEYGRVSESVLRRCLASPDEENSEEDYSGDESDTSAGGIVFSSKSKNGDLPRSYHVPLSSSCDSEDGCKREMSMQAQSCVFLCGSDEFVNDTCVPALKSIGFASDKIFVF
ncbi:hypothetical protein HDU83_003955 [Entophlyctis luteolus]|nr:hypothetical protein HDU83_003955 [Entophlyctis luteolus]